MREAYEKLSLKKARQKGEAISRRRELPRKQLQREGLLPASKKKTGT
jgi:small subunit ribosomal protein S21